MTEPRYRLTPVPFDRVRFTDRFWAPRLQTNRTVTLFHVYEQSKASGRIDALRLNWQPGDAITPHVFWDSDVAKWLEGACYSLVTHPDPALAALVEQVVDLIVAAQQPDGYLNVYYTVVEPEKRWVNLRDRHELYCAGHLIEAAVAHFQATGERRFLETMMRYADYIGTVFGPESDQRQGYPGHQEIELALVKLYHATGEARYLELSAYFINQRGQQPHYYDLEAWARGEDPAAFWARTYAYNQSHLPVREQDEALGHAVRAMYMTAAMADLAAESGDATLLAACQRLWESATGRKMYITGGLGSEGRHEGFGPDYDLPNAAAYAETCAAIALVFFAARMLRFEGDGRYTDVLERALYNNVLSGVSYDGRTFFYINPLQAAGDHRRQDFFSCACCPPNLTRLLASLGQHVYATAEDALYVHLYAGSEAEVDFAGQHILLRQETDYPYAGLVNLMLGLAQPAPFDLRLRIPGWCREFTLAVNGEPVEPEVVLGYAVLKRTWQPGDRVTLDLAMPVERMVALPAVAADAGQTAIQRGPLVYCLEAVDHDGTDVRAFSLPDEAALMPREVDLFGGTVVIETEGLRPAPGSEGLYSPLNGATAQPVALRLIPYALWANRAPGTMTVWLPRA